MGLERKRLGDSVGACPSARQSVRLSLAVGASEAPPARRGQAPASPPLRDWRPVAPGLVRAPVLQGRGIPGWGSEGGGEEGGEGGERRGGRDRPPREVGEPWVRLGKRNLSAPRDEPRRGRLR